MRRQFVWSVAIVLLVIALIAVFYRPILWSMALIGPLIVLGFRYFWQPDRLMAQTLQFKSITPGPKQLPWIVEPLGRLESYVYVTEQPTMVLAFATQ